MHVFVASLLFATECLDLLQSWRYFACEAHSIKGVIDEIALLKTAAVTRARRRRVGQRHIPPEPGEDAWDRDTSHQSQEKTRGTETHPTRARRRRVGQRHIPLSQEKTRGTETHPTRARRRRVGQRHIPPEPGEDAWDRDTSH